MKGMIFTVFFEMVEEVFSMEVLETIIEEAHLPNEGAYTTIGTYDHHQLVTLVEKLSELTKVPVSDLEIAYGKYLFKKFLTLYPKLILKCNSAFEFLFHVDNHIHQEVLKLYPDASLPSFECTLLDPKTMSMEYHSNNPFACLAQGLILGCAEHFKEKLEVQVQDLGSTAEKKYNFIFLINKQG